MCSIRFLIPNLESLMKRILTLLLFTLILSSLCRGEETDNSSLFGITVTNTVSEAEKLFQEGSGHMEQQQMAPAIECFKKAAGLGHAQAQFNLAVCYMQGNGVEASDKEAAKWFEKAAKQDVKEALYPLGLCFYNLEQYIEAYAWALAAEAAGDPRLKQMLAPMYPKRKSPPARPALRY